MKHTYLAFIQKIPACFLLTLLLFPGIKLSAQQPSAESTNPKTESVISTETGKDKPEEKKNPLKNIIAPVPIPILPPMQGYELKDNTIDIIFSEYAGYAGLFLANKGLEPKEDSFFFKKYGFKVRIKMNETLDMKPLQTGEIAAYGDTADRLGTFGGSLECVCGLLLDFSRGADQFVMRKEYKEPRDLLGKTVAVASYSESEFLLRYLCRNNALNISYLKGWDDTAKPNVVNFLLTDQADQAADVLAYDMQSGGPKKIAACIGWAPHTEEVSEKSNGKAYIAYTTRNQLLIADVVLLNKGFAKKYPKLAKGLLHGILEGNQKVETLVKNNQKSELEVVIKSLTTNPDEPWTFERLRDDLSKIDRANYNTNIAFFNDTMPLGASFPRIYNLSATLFGRKSYADEYKKYVSTALLLEIGKENPKLTEEPIQLRRVQDPKAQHVLTYRRNIHLEFSRDTFDHLPEDSKNNQEMLSDIAETYKYSPGATIHLIGHVDDSLAEEKGREWKKKNTSYARIASLKRAEVVKKMLEEQYGVDSTRITIEGKGWDSPLTGALPQENRRVEVLLYTVN